MIGVCLRKSSHSLSLILQNDSSCRTRSASRPWITRRDQGRELIESQQENRNATLITISRHHSSSLCPLPAHSVPQKLDILLRLVIFAHRPARIPSRPPVKPVKVPLSCVRTPSRVPVSPSTMPPSWFTTEARAVGRVESAVRRPAAVRIVSHQTFQQINRDLQDPSAVLICAIAPFRSVTKLSTVL